MKDNDLLKSTGVVSQIEKVFMEQLRLLSDFIDYSGIETITGVSFQRWMSEKNQAALAVSPYYPDLYRKISDGQDGGIYLIKSRTRIILNESATAYHIVSGYLYFERGRPEKLYSESIDGFKKRFRLEKKSDA